MRHRRSIYSVIMLICVFCFLGLSIKDAPQRLSVSVPEFPLDFGDRISYYEWDTYDARQLGEVRILDWEQVIGQADKNVTDPKEFFIDENEFSLILQNNVFLFSRLGICTRWHPSLWDLNTSLGYKRWGEMPNSYTLRKLLTDPKQENVRRQFVQTAIRVLNHPDTKRNWEKQRNAFLSEHDYILLDSNNQYDKQADYTRMQNAGYESSMIAAMSALTRLIDSTDHDMKVVPAYNGWWLAVRVINNIFDLVDDDSPLKIRFACFRMGKEASLKLKEYVGDVRKQITVK
ncbi:MAG: hypothetical protein U1B83_09490 [Candidatus Cloacimonadaceae bacterium]|nr:hypothetical protein [Candidatus Cloacimonadaceae bacterium]